MSGLNILYYFDTYFYNFYKNIYVINMFGLIRDKDTHSAITFDFCAKRSIYK